ncbi:MAG: thioredoxin fold domain-containing protein [Chromatiales bacterium]|nr:thioredoxin fold domain-containing protein [Chromatiales bacterium]
MLTARVHRLLALALMLPVAGALAATTAHETALGAGMVNPGYEEKPGWFKSSFLDIREDVAEARDAGRRVLLYFYQDGCPYCAKLLRENLAVASIVQKLRQDYDVIAINLWGDREVTGFDGSARSEKDFSTDLRVMFTPTLLLLDSDGAVALRINGYYPPDQLEAALDYVTAGGSGRAGFRSFVAARESAFGTLGVSRAGPGFLSPPFHLNARDALSGRPLLVVFDQGNCRACDELHGDIFSRAATRELLAGFDVAVLDANSTTSLTTPAGETTSAAAWARALGVVYTPSLVFFDAGGSEVFRTEGYLKSFHVQASLAYVGEGAYRTQPSFQRFVQSRADALRARGVEVDLMN